ncbi:MAG TPA: amino acid adenylation domain-containing protein, partial [Thermoanaerobaculia bacterium]|nr:amino acid adenylation domain-containing protein [Thermoanaerobaculia bacterium]
MIEPDPSDHLESLPVLAGGALPDTSAGSAARLSYGERSLWFLHHLAPGDGAYNIAAAAAVRSPLASGALERAFQGLVDRHAALRTAFPAVAGEPCRRIEERAELALAREDATGWSEERLRSRLAEEAWRPFDIERGPLLRVTLLEGGPGGPVILLVIHHIVADFWSLAVLLRELPVLYREAIGSGAARLPAPGWGAEEQVRLEREALAGGRGEALLAWWRERLAGLPTLELVTDRPRPAVQTYRGDCRRLRLPGELAAALRARGRAQHGTLFMTLVAAFQALLCRHTGQEDLAIGAPRAGRSHARLAGTVGYFVNPVVLRGDLSGDPTFTELLERTRAMVLAAFEHGDCPLPLLAEQLQPARDASRTPLFQVSFVMQKETRGVEGLTAFALGEEGVAVGPEDFRLESLSLDRPPAPFDLQLHLVERQGGLSLALQYNTDLFDGTTAERLLERFATLLGALVRSPDLALSALPIASEVERHQLLCAWNDTAQPGSPANLFELFSAQAEQSPDEPAVVFEDEQVTYRELAARAEALAYHLAGLGVGPEALVGVAAERSVELVVGLLGVLGAGGAYLPLEPDLPRQRLEMILADSRPSVLLTRRSLVGALPLDAVPGVRLAWLEEMADLPRGAAAPRLPRTAADNAAYVLFTSGSTGRPKGVVNSHRGIVNRLLWMQEALGLDASDRFLQKTPFGFDVSVPEFFMPLILGGRLIVARPEGHRDSAYLSRLVEREGVTTIHFVPSMLPFFLAEEGVAARCRSLRRVIVSGEALAWELEQRCLEVLPAPLYNLYGPTEAAVEVMAWQCRPAARPRPVPIGRPILKTQIHVVGRRLEPVPAGAVGELVIGGVQVARGYRGRSDLTAERFVPDPFGPPGARLYRTGDLCRHLPGGEIEYLGRLDDQVKIRGVRIEPREIEIALTAHPEVREAAVVVRQDPAGERSLLACMVLREGEPGPAEAAALRDFLTARLPPSMVPAVAFGAELPRLPNGKLDRRALARWTPAAESARSFLAPRTPLEELLAGLFAELLGVDRIGVADSFFEAGGHSLAAMRLIARVRETLGVDLPLYRVFEMPTVADLVRSIEGAARSEVPPLVPVPRDRPLPLSFAQQRLWFLHQLEPASPAYNMSAAVHLEGRLDRAALAAALGDVVRRHETLRTRFAAPGGEPVQVIDPPALLPVPMVDLAYLPAGCRTEEARRLVRAEALRPFDLAAGPLLRVALVRLGDSEQLLLLAMHHIVGDAWSLRVLARELAVLYSAFAEGLPSPLPELEIQYGDYTVWQRRWFQGETLEAELAHWRSRLADAPSVLDLPLDRPRSAGVSDRGASRAVALPPALLPSLQALARRQRVTLFMAVLAAFQALLSRVSNTEDVSVGTPVAGRRQIRTEGLIGFFVNTLVMRTDLSGDPSFTALLARVREVALAAYAHQDLPFDRLVEELHPRRDLSHAPLFQVSFDLDDEPPPPPRLGEVAGSLWPLELETEKFDLRLTLTVEAEVLSGALGFRTGLFDGATIERLAGHFMRLLVGAVQESWRRLSELPLLSAEEREQILVEWNDTATAAQRAPLVHELVLAWARRRPESLAVTAPGERLAYGELAARARSLARVLGRLGVGPEVRVALCAGPTVHRVVGSLAVLLAGGVYVPLDPEAPPERLSFLVADSGAAVVLTEQALAGRLHECTARRLLLEEAGRVEEKGLFSASVVDPDNLAYVVYTSGSTGLPKGVAISHAGLLNLVRWHCERYGVGPADRATLIANPAFDASVWEIWPYLAAGASLHVPSEEMRLAPSAIVRFWRREGITWSFLPTPLAEEVIAEPSAWAGLSLKGLLCGGDRLHRPPETALPFSLINHYGPSEVSVVTTCTAVRPGLSGAPPIGRPILNLRTYVVALHGALAPRGVAGELWIGGEGLGRGYLARPDLTAERFVPDPWSGEAGGRLYRTGDLMRHQRDGSLEFLGRIDHQIKLRGFRIEPGEIEAVLRAHPAVSEAVVATFAPRREHRRLVAYVVGVEGRAPSSHELRKFLRERLPGYMVPGVFVALPALPLTPNGKLDRKALPEPAPEAGEEIVAPRTPAEELVAGIFAEVLGLEQVGVNESFFELGGHSLLATQVASRVHTVFGVELPVRAVFEAPTVLELAGWIETSAADERSRGPAIVPVSRDEPPPMSFAQERLWFLDRLEPGSPLYNIPVAVALTGRLDVPVLAAALSTVVERHETLRTTFGLAGGPVQIIALHATVALPVIDLRDLPGMARAAEVERLAAAEARRPFDLGHLGGGPLLRSTLVALALQEHLALITLPHIVSDGWSMGVLVHELGALYAAFLDRRPSPLPELSIQYADFAVWQRSRLSGELLESELAWWRGQLAGMPPALELPTDHPRPAVRTIGGAVHGFTIARESLGALAALSRRHGTTLFMTLLAGFLALLKRTTGADDLVVGSPIAGRLRVETEPLIGLFVNTLVLRTDLSGDPDFLTLLGRVRETTLAAYVHQEVPFERLVEELAPERDLSRTPLVHVVLALQNAPTGPLELPGLLLTPSAVHTGTAKFELTCLVMETERGLEGTLEYSRRLLDGPTVERLAQRFTRLLAGAAADPQRRLSELPLLASGERHQILAEWNDTRAPFPAETLLHQFFEAAVDRAPQTVAAVCGSSALTYGELEAWANRLAHLLRSAGIGRGAPVGVWVERSFGMLAAVLGILKAGGHYVALDETWPADRVEAILAATGVPAIVTGSGLLAAVEEMGGRLPELAEVVCLDLADPRPAGGKRWWTAWHLERSAASRPPAVSGPDDIAYVIHTSGSTGEPKGIVVQHRPAANLIDWINRTFAVGPEDRGLFVTSLCFDLSVYDIFGLLAAGGTVHIAAKEDLAEPDRLVDLMRTGGITLWDSAPAALVQLAPLFPAEPERASRLRRVLLSGDWIPVTLPDRVRRAFPEAQVLALGGATEATVWSNWYPVGMVDPAWPSIPYGRPIANARYHVLDAGFSPCPIGVPGDLYIGGGCLCSGYARRPDLTARAFLPDPFVEEPGARLYRTGDRARYKADGNLEFLGRVDHQVKIRGYRIELGEIEVAIARHPEVREAVVMVREDQPGDRRLVAYVVPASAPDSPALSPADLRDALRRSLPDYMVPSAFVLLSELPVTPNGKLDRTALPAPVRSAARGSTAPQTPLEETLAEIWADVLGVAEVGREDSFFDLGGHSLLATQLMARIREVWGVELPLRALFERPTLEDLAAAVEAARATGEPSTAPALRPIARTGQGLPLSFAQQRLWFLDQLEPGSPLYSIPAAIELAGRLDGAALAAALGE